MAFLSKLVLALFLFTLAAGPISGAEIGVCYGNLGNNLPPPPDVVHLYKSNNIRKMRIYSPDSNILNALKGSNIELIVDVPNDQIQRLASDPSEAGNWVRTNIQAYSPDVNFKYIAVGNEVTERQPDVFRSIATAMENIHNAISSVGLGDRIRVSTATFMASLGVSYPPSNGAFKDEVKPFLRPVIDFLKRTNSPLLVNVYPYFAYNDNKGQVNLDYALFRPSGVVLNDGGFVYRNLFDAMVDAVYSALEKEGGGNVDIVVSESGWPSEGNSPTTSLDSAGTYNQNLVKHIQSGTPKRSGKAIETYIFAMFDENEKRGEETEKHFGLFNPNQQPKYPIDFN